MSGGASRDAARLHVHLLGTVEVVLDSEPLSAFGGLRLQRFLGLLVLRPELGHRSRLAFELWPDSHERQARTNLRKLIHDFRQALPDHDAFVEIGSEVVRWLGDGPSRVDVDDFRTAVAAGDLALAARSYGGDLLPACYDDWVLDERAKLRAAALDAFLRLARQAESTGDHQATIDHAGRALEVDAADETAVEMQMEANLALGRRAAAIRTYHRYAEVLERDLGVAPSEAVENRYLQLRSDASGGERDRRAEPSTKIVDAPFVGRDDEFGRLADAWGGVQQNGAHLVLVAGEPGIGKSRLAAELARRVREEGHPVASARAYEAAGRLPWGPVVDLLRSNSLRTQVEALDPAWRIELARLLPELAEDDDAGARPAAAQPAGDAAARRRLFDAVSRVMAADHRPRLLIVDDLQWCDVETVELLGFLIRAWGSAPVLVVGTLRTEEVGDDHAVNDLVTALLHDRAVTTISLEPLDQRATGLLAAGLRSEREVDPDLAARLWAETEGNPLFVIEALRASFQGETPSALTPTVRAVLQARLGQLSDDARALVEVAAVVGRPFEVDLMAAVTGSEEHHLVEWIDELWRRRILRDHGVTYDFSHDKLRAVALEMVSPARRRQLHRDVAAALAGATADASQAAARLAAHYDQAGMVEPAISAYHAAGRRAVAVSALEEAVTMFRRALSLLAELPDSRERDALELDMRIALGSPLVALEGYGATVSHQLYERAHALCRKLGRKVDPAILRGLGLARLQGCRFEESSAMGQSLVDHDEDDPVSATEGRYLLGVSAFWRGDLRAARDHLDQALAAYDASRRDQHLALYAQDPSAVCTVRCGWVALWTGDPGSADELARSALALARDLDHLMTQWYVLTYATIIAAESDDLPRVVELLDHADELGRRLPVPYLMIVLDALRGWVQMRDGIHDGIEVISTAASRSRTEGESLHLTYILLLLARAEAMAGRPDSGRAAIREGLSWSDEHDQRYLEAELWRTEGELWAAVGEMAEAEAAHRVAVDVASSQGAGWLELRALTSLARIAPDQHVRDRLTRRCAATPTGHDLPPFRAATAVLAGTASEGTLP